VLDKERRARHGADHPITRETARWLALWMGYEDVIRVADLKSRASRYSRVRAESKAKPGEPVMITEFLKPGIDEIASILPRALGERLVTWGEKRGLRGTWHMRMRVRTDTILGFLRLRLMARLKPLRRRSWRFALEQAAIERWLGAVVAAAGDPDLAREIAECGRLMKGYSETRERAFANLDRIFNELIDPLVSGRIAGAGLGAGDVAAARQAALADEAGERLTEVLGAIAGKAANGGKQAPAQAAE
jgi:indolepyruvate ferredoxin oxidoreductase beta subunit